MTTLSELIEGTDWPSPLAAQAFLNECEIGWGTEDGRAEITRWVEVLGKPSQFLGHKLWTVEDLREHFTKLSEYEKAEEAAKVEDEPSTEKGRPRSPDKVERQNAVRLASATWHDAVEQRRHAVLASKEAMAEQIRTIREAHDKFVKDWDAYVDHTRENLRVLRGY